MLAVATDDAYCEPPMVRITDHDASPMCRADQHLYEQLHPAGRTGGADSPKDITLSICTMGDVGVAERRFLDAANGDHGGSGPPRPEGLWPDPVHACNLVWPRAGERGQRFPADYHKFYKGSEIVRCRRKGYSTMRQPQRGFLYFRTAICTAVCAHTGASFCEHRSFIPRRLPSTGENAYTLHRTGDGLVSPPLKRGDQRLVGKMDHSSARSFTGLDIGYSDIGVHRGGKQH